MKLHCILPITYSDCNHFHSALELAEVRRWSVLDCSTFGQMFTSFMQDYSGFLGVHFGHCCNFCVLTAND
jgi:hypothetical protein